jgi:hypothetical protein
VRGVFGENGFEGLVETDVDDVRVFVEGHKGSLKSKVSAAGLREEADASAYYNSAKKVGVIE